MALWKELSLFMKILEIHAIKIIGWGVTEDGVKYWLCANSWNERWGENGYFRILRGEDECGIDESAATGMPKIE